MENDIEAMKEEKAKLKAQIEEIDRKIKQELQKDKVWTISDRVRFRLHHQVKRNDSWLVLLKTTRLAETSLTSDENWKTIIQGYNKKDVLDELSSLIRDLKELHRIVCNSDIDSH